MNTTTTDKVQVGDSTTGTSTSIKYKVSSPPTEYGWACPRCGRINAPWKSQCDCLGGNWYPTWYPWDYKEPWWKQVYCDSDTFKVHPETTTWKAPSSVCHSDSASVAKADPNTSTYVTANNPPVGGSDYWNPVTKTWENVSYTLTNVINDKMQELQSQIDNLKETK